MSAYALGNYIEAYECGWYRGGRKLPSRSHVRIMALGRELFVALMATDDAGEGFRAFFEKRPPQFTDS